ncbi:phosphate-starvation-inducible PsiE family protein [Thiohalocapsa marina]|nr:phosphate-starvation-inducible PsiE family protein [Thiohalocapsa marina]
MPDVRFNVEFAGDLMPGADQATARIRLQTLFKLSDDAAERLFSGLPVTLKRNVDGAVAAQLHAAFADAGAMTRIVPASTAALQPSGAGAAAAVPELDPFGWGKPPGQVHSHTDKAFHLFERSLAFVLLVLISVVAVIAVVELCFVLYKDLVSTTGFLLGLNELFEVFGMFLIVLIAIELMASIYMYMMDKSVHVEMMLLIAITALTRKVVVLDLESKGDPALYMLGMAALLATLIGGFYLVKRLDYRHRSDRD